MMLWLVRVAWASLPITAGPAAAAALEDWSAPPRTLAEALLWAAWAIALVALFAPRPLGLTVVRVVAPSFVVLAVVVLVTGAADAREAGVAVAATLLAGTLAVASPSLSLACANGAAYGDERRYPLRIPPVLWLGMLPSAPLLVATGVAAGPLLLADARVGAGAAALVVGPSGAARLRRRANDRHPLRSDRRPRAASQRGRPAHPRDRVTPSAQRDIRNEDRVSGEQETSRNTAQSARRGAERDHGKECQQHDDERRAQETGVGNHQRARERGRAQTHRRVVRERPDDRRDHGFRHSATGSRPGEDNELQRRRQAHQRQAHASLRRLDLGD